MRYRIQAILFVLVAFMLGCNEYMIVGVLPSIYQDLKIPLSLLGLLVTLFAMVYSICTPIISIVCNRFKRHNVLFILLTIFLLANTWTALAPNFISILLSRILSGSTAGAIISITIIMASFIAPPAKRASLISWVFAGFSIANVAGVPIGNKIAELGSWRNSFWMVTILTIFIFAALIVYAPRDTPQLNIKNDTSKKSHQGGAAFIKDKRTILTCLFIVFVCAAQFSYYTYITKILTESMGFKTELLSPLLFILGFVSIIGNKIGGYIAGRGNMKDIPWLYLFMTIALVVTGFTMQLRIFAFILIALICIVNCSYGSSVTVFLLDIASHSYPQALDLASSLNPVFSNVGIAVGSLVAAQAINFISIAQIVFISAIFAFIAFILAMTIKYLIR